MPLRKEKVGSEYSLPTQLVEKVQFRLGFFALVR